jgi:hypothetical protein
VKLGMVGADRRRVGREPREPKAPVVEVVASVSGGAMCEKDLRWPVRPCDCEGKGTVAVAVAVGTE